MTKLERQEKHRIDTARKNAAAMHKKMSTTLRWMDIQEVDEDHIVIEVKCIEMYQSTGFCLIIQSYVYEWSDLYFEHGKEALQHFKK